MNSKLMKSVLYPIGVLVGVELTFHLIKLWKKRFVSLLSNKKLEAINEVHFVDDTTIDCIMDFKCKTNKDHSCDNENCYYRILYRMIYFIDNAKKSIDLAMFCFVHDDLCDALLRASKRNVYVRMICGADEFHLLDSDFVTLNSEAGIPCRFYCTQERKLMHHKFCVIDGRTDIERLNIPKLNEFQNYNEEESEEDEQIQPILINGSINWTFKGLSKNWNNIIITSKRKLVNNFQTQFNRLWEYFDPENPMFFDRCIKNRKVVIY